MDIERQSELLSASLDTCLPEYRSNIETFRTPKDYASALQKLLLNALSPKGRSWLDEMGGTHCGIVFPSESLVAPIEIFFPISLDVADRLPEGRAPWKPADDGSTYSFFGREFMSVRGTFQFLFDIDGDSPQAEKRNRSRLLQLTPGFADYLEECAKSDSPFLQYPDDDRQKAFFAKNSTIIARYFNTTPDYLEHRQWDICFAMSELLDIRQETEYEPQYCFLGRYNDGRHWGVFCFFFRKQIPSDSALMLRLLLDLLFSCVVEVDRSEYQRKSANFMEAMSKAQKEFHDIRNSMATLRNRLQVVSRNMQRRGVQESNQVILALKSQSELQEQIDVLESLALRSQPPKEHIYSPRKILEVLEIRYEARFKQQILAEVFRDVIDLDLQFKGSVADLVEALRQLIDGALTQIEEKAPRRKRRRRRKKVYLQISLANSSGLLIKIVCPRRIPEYLEESIRTNTVLGRLPSGKQGGGRGILSSIALIRTQFQGACTLADSYDLRFEDPSTHEWTIELPVTSVAQYPLF